MAYQQQVVMGVAVPNPKYNKDFDMTVAFYGPRVVRWESVEPYFFVKMRSAAADESRDGNG